MPWNKDSMRSSARSSLDRTDNRQLLISSHDAAKESNLPSRGLPGPASFEDWMGHQARAAPRMIVGLRPETRRRWERTRDDAARLQVSTDGRRRGARDHRRS